MADPYEGLGVTAAPSSAPPASSDDPYAGLGVSAPPETVIGKKGDYTFSVPGAPPERQRPERTPGIDWLGTRLTNMATGIAGMPRAAADINRWAADKLNVPPGVTNALLMTNPLTMMGQVMPSTGQMRGFIKNKIGMPEVNTPGPAGKIIDAGIETAMTPLPGNVIRNAIPMFTGGAASETAGEATKGTPYEIPARLLAGLGAGGFAAVVQNAGGNVVQAVKNLMPNVDDTTAKIIARGLQRDQTTGPQFEQAHRDLGPGALAVEAAGPNLRGTMRGAIAPQGAARTTAQQAFDPRQEGLNTQVTQALDKNVGPLNSLGTTVEDLAALRSQKSGPAWQAAGVPERPIKTETQITPDELTAKLQAGKPMTLAEINAQAKGEPMAGKPTFNTPNVDDPVIANLLKRSRDIKKAIGAARGMPDYQELPANSMSMLDKAYGYLNDLQQEALRAGKGRRANDLNNLREDMKKALVEANPAYGRALETYKEPSKLIDAGNRAKEWFTANVDPAIVRREFEAMPPIEQEMALVGARDWARTVTGRTDRGVSGLNVFNGTENRARWEAILPPGQFKSLSKTIDVVRNAKEAAADINVGSRTVPMAHEAADNASQINALSNLGQGRFLTAGGQMLKGLVDRVGQGRSEAVNANISKLLTSTDPKDVGLVAALAERARLAELARGSNRRNALAAGAFAAPARSTSQ